MEGEPNTLCPAVTMFRDTFRTPFPLKHLLPEKLLLLAKPSGSRNSGAKSETDASLVLTTKGCHCSTVLCPRRFAHCWCQKTCPLLVPEDLPTAGVAAHTPPASSGQGCRSR